MGRNFPRQAVFSIPWFIFFLSWAVRGNAIQTARAWLGVHQRCRPRCCSQDARQSLGEDKTAELKSLPEESKRLRHLLAKSGQLRKAHYRSRGWNESCQEPFKVSKFSGILPEFEDQICIWQSFSLAMFWKRLLSLILYFSLSTSIFPLWFSGIKELKVILLLCLIMTMQPPRMVVQLSYKSGKFYYFCRVFFLYFHIPAPKILYIYS